MVLLFFYYTILEFSSTPTESGVLSVLAQSDHGEKMPPLPGTFKRICGQFSFTVFMDYFNTGLLMFEPLMEKSSFTVNLNSSILPAISVSLYSFTPINLNVSPALLTLIETSKVFNYENNFLICILF
jgi:hypothetical protein